MKHKKLYCGKCGNNPMSLMKEIKGAVHYDLDEEGYVKDESEECDTFAPTGKILAFCICGNIWRVKRVREISYFYRKEAPHE